jgi:hypothetical protein
MPEPYHQSGKYPETVEGMHATIDRLRARTHDIAAEHQTRTHRMERDLARCRERFAKAREYTKHWKVEWTTDPASQKEDGWWRYTSCWAIDNVTALVARAEEAEAAVAELAGVLHQAYLAADTRELALTIRAALIKYDTDPEAA